MPEPEFESYLSLMSKLLRLTQGQRAEITAELRDHLDERLHELQAQGHERARAIELALEELGDATALAVDFTHPHLTRRRRQVMRYSIYSVAVITATFVLAAFYWPAQRQEQAVQVTAQAPPEKPDNGAAALAIIQALTSPKDDFRQQVELKLERRDLTVRFVDTTLTDVFSFLSAELEMDFVLDRRHLSDQGIDPGDVTITLELRTESITVRTLLELVLQQAGAGGLSYVIRDGVVLITSPEEGHEVQVYDCRDLLANVKVESTPVMGMMGGGGIAGEGLNPYGGEFGGMGIGQPTGATSPAARALIQVIVAATGDDWMIEDGMGGTISEFDGLLVVRHSQRAHRNIEDLLAKLREKKAQASAKVGASSNRTNPQVLPVDRILPVDRTLFAFMGKWAGPSQEMTPIIAHLVEQGYPVRTTDVDRESELVTQYNITSVPTFVLVDGAHELMRHTGISTEAQLRDMLQKKPEATAPPARVDPNAEFSSRPAPGLSPFGGEIKSATPSSRAR
jgi:hypothetical protein